MIFCRIGSEERRFSGLFGIDGSREPAGRSAVLDGHEGRSGVIKTDFADFIFLEGVMWSLHTPTENLRPLLLLLLHIRNSFIVHLMK